MFRKIYFSRNSCLLVDKIKNVPRCLPSNLYFSDKTSQDSPEAPPTVMSRYEPFRDDRSPIILDVEEERRKSRSLAIEEEKEEESNEFQGISPERGVEGVIDLHELVEVLRKEKGQDIFVVQVPQEYRYVQHMVIVSGKSARHMLGMVEFVRKVYKYKRGSKDVIPSIEGKGSKHWIALDLGNIALHVFSKTRREEYDLESLWALGCDHDKLSNQPDDPLIQMLKEHSKLIGDVTKIDTNN